MIIVHIFLFALFCGCVVLTVTREAKRDIFFSTQLVFSVLALIYFCAIPVEFMLRSEEGYYRHDTFLNVAAVISPVLATSAAAVGLFYIGLRLSRFSPRFTKNGQVAHPRMRTRLTFKLCAAFVVFLVIFRNELIASTNSYLDVAAVGYDHPAFLLSKYVFLIAFAFLGLIKYYEGFRTTSVCLLTIPLVFGVLTTDKNSLMFSIIAVGVIAAGLPMSRRRTVLYLTLFAVVMVPLLYLLDMFSYLRAGVDISTAFLISVQNFSFSRMDPGGPFAAIVSYWGGGDLKFGLTFFNNLLLIVPRFLFPERPLDLAEEFAREMITTWEPGQGLGFSPLAEAFMNFGVLAPFYFFIVGLLWGWIWRFVKSIWVSFFGYYHFAYFYRVVGYYIIVLFFRGSSLDLIKILPLYSLASIALLLVIGYRVSNNAKSIVGT